MKLVISSWNSCLYIFWNVLSYRNVKNHYWCGSNQMFVCRIILPLLVTKPYAQEGPHRDKINPCGASLLYCPNMQLGLLKPKDIFLCFQWAVEFYFSATLFSVPLGLCTLLYIGSPVVDNFIALTLRSMRKHLLVLFQTCQFLVLTTASLLLEEFASN